MMNKIKKIGLIGILIGILFSSCSDDDCDGTEVMIGNELQCIEGFGEVSDFEINTYYYHDSHGIIQLTDNGWVKKEEM